MRFFKVQLAALPEIYAQVRSLLDQPNPRADEPFLEHGNFSNGEWAYLAFGPHHCEGEFADLIDQFIGLPGVEEITEEQYRAAMPDPELYDA